MTGIEEEDLVYFACYLSADRYFSFSHLIGNL